MSERISIDRYFMEITEVVKKRSTCVRRQVGAVLVKGNHILSTGYNGCPKKLEHCTKDTCLRHINNIPSGTQPEICRAVHAEANCIIQCATNGTKIEGFTTLYCTNHPCIDCLKLILNAGIKRVVYLMPYNVNNDTLLSLIKESNIRIQRFNIGINLRPEEVMQNFKNIPKNNEEIALYCKKMEIDALKTKDKIPNDTPPTQREMLSSYWDAKAQAFSQVWEHIVFDGKKVGEGVHPLEYNKQNDIYSKKVSEI